MFNVQCKMENQSLLSVFGLDPDKVNIPFADDAPKRFRFGIYDDRNPDSTERARRVLGAYIYSYMKQQSQWLPAYEDVAQWLTDNHGRGLIIVGTPGLGKSLICTRVLPRVLKDHFDRSVLSVTATEMCDRIDELLKYCQPGHFIIIDDLGTEPAETVTYGNRRKPFCQLVDAAERTGTLLIITSNLRTTALRLKQDCQQGRAGDIDPHSPASIELRYGAPTLDRLRAITRAIAFIGKSMR